MPHRHCHSCRGLQGAPCLGPLLPALEGRAFLPTLLQLGAVSMQVAPLLCQAPSQKQGCTRGDPEGGASRGISGWEFHRLQKLLNQKGVELSLGRRWEERRDPVLSCSNLHLLHSGTGRDVQETAANTGGEAAAPHCPKHITPR